MNWWLCAFAAVIIDAASISSDPAECQFLCDVTKCIDNSRRCDGIKDCDDLSDENDCTRCEFMCDVDKCIENTRRCDGVDDCGDLTDERNCVQSEGGDWDEDSARKALRVAETGANSTAEEKTLHHLIPFLKPKERDMRCTGAKSEPGQCVAVETCPIKELYEDYVKYKGYFCVTPEQQVGVCCPFGYSWRVKRQTTAAPAVVNIDEQKKEPEGDGVDYTYLGEPDRCGFSSKQLARVQRPQTAGMRDYPWIVALLTVEYFHYCGGTIVSPRYILTAAHCVPPGTLAEKMIVRVGEYDFRLANDSQAADYKVEQILAHEDYDTGTYENDIALLKLSEPVTYGVYVQPVCLPTRPQDIANNFTDTNTVVAGWGTTEYGGPMSDVLMEVPVPVWEQEECVNSFTQTVFDSAMCAAGHEGGKDSCQGDSGGPLVTQRDDGRWMTIGVVSWGVRCGEKGKPGVYTRINRFIPWIAAHLQP